MLTGNNGFENLLTILLSLSLLDDEIIKRKKSFEPELSKGSSGWIEKFITGSLLAVITHLTIQYFNISLSNTSFLNGPTTKINFTLEDFNWFLSQQITVSIWLGSVGFAIVSLFALYK